MLKKPHISISGDVSQHSGKEVDQHSTSLGLDTHLSAQEHQKSAQAQAARLSKQPVQDSNQDVLKTNKHEDVLKSVQTLMKYMPCLGQFQKSLQDHHLRSLQFYLLSPKPPCFSMLPNRLVANSRVTSCQHTSSLGDRKYGGVWKK